MPPRVTKNLVRATLQMLSLVLTLSSGGTVLYFLSDEAFRFSSRLTVDLLRQISFAICPMEQPWDEYRSISSRSSNARWW